MGSPRSGYPLAVMLEPVGQSPSKYSSNMKNYDYYNREERAICAHLFRLLHERLKEKHSSPLGQFLKILSQSNLEFKNGTVDFNTLQFNNVAIYCETSIIRDAYQNAKPDVNGFMDRMTRLLMKQENVKDCRLYSQLPDPLSNISSTHPKQIRQKAESKGIKLTDGESKVFGAMQGMFNAKPDLVITIDNLLFVCEAKHTEKFDDKQLIRTWNISEVWSELLFEDLGFIEKPVYSVFKLGASDFMPHVSWADVSKIADVTYTEDDRTRIAIKSGVYLLDRQMNKEIQHYI